MVHRLDGLNLLENFHRLTFPKIISSGNTYAFDFSNITPFSYEVFKSKPLWLNTKINRFDVKNGFSKH